MDSKKTFKILSIDGGGIRGVYSAHILKRIEEEFDLKLHDYFDLIAGTSTGSIIAGGIACNIPIQEIENLYIEKGNDIFTKRKNRLIPFLPCLGAFISTYSANPLKKILDEKFSDKKLKDVDKKLIIPSTDVYNGDVFIAKSNYHKDFVRDLNIKVADAILGSCSAPMYFDPHPVGSYLLADGGLWANNPSLIAMIDAIKRCDETLANIKILSIGTGLYKPEFKSSKKWGIWNGWKHKKLIDLIFSLQSQSAHNYLSLLLEKEQIKRINYESEVEQTLDDCSHIDKLISKADLHFTKNADELKSFLEIKD